MKPIILDVECIVCNKTLQKFLHDPRVASIEMGKITNKRSRTPNWSVDEKQYLLELIKRNKEVVVTKSNNGPNHSEEKDAAWNEILRHLTVKFGTKFAGFSIKKVKTQWQNMKRIAREEIAINGSMIHNFTRQSLEVCDILDLVKDGVLKKENVNDNEPMVTTNVEIKSESIDEDVSINRQPSSSEKAERLFDIPQENSDSIIILNEDRDKVEMEVQNTGRTKSTYSMTEDFVDAAPFQRELQEFLKYTATEKELKMESLKDERQVVRAMRETAELNKIVAEQKLKHILWIQKQEMT